MSFPTIDLLTDPGDAKATVKAVVFYIASERARGTRLLKVLHPDDKNTQVLLARKLRKLRAGGRIVCFSQAGAVKEEEAQALYIADKVPQVTEDGDFFMPASTVTYILLA